ncbi:MULTISPECIES: hypothetical protein [unclassified Sphingobacterium]|uniref:hypothetical protein n=1 Tax=unclassified Sphingobacterium TaxID=2609468 RepID=UPI0025F927E5|nr:MULTISPECIES: hypothetical protein [unclassified Sphingobacterium]
MSSRQLEELQEEKRDRAIAEELGITYEELGETNFEIDPDNSEDGVVYGYYIVFKDGSSQEVLDKIDGLENNRVYFDTLMFSDEPDDDFDPYNDGDEKLTDGERKIAEQEMFRIAEENRRNGLGN